MSVVAAIIISLGADTLGPPVWRRLLIDPISRVRKILLTRLSQDLADPTWERVRALRLQGGGGGCHGGGAVLLQ